jgi:hypothetical protein
MLKDVTVCSTETAHSVKERTDGKLLASAYLNFVRKKSYIRDVERNVLN